MKKAVVDALNKQIAIEEDSSRIYLAMASWCETAGFPGAAKYLYVHSDEERIHQLKLMAYVNTMDGHALLSKLDQPVAAYKTLKQVFEIVLKHEKFVTASINKLLEVCMKEKDYTTTNFLQWYVTEQVEEEASAKEILDKIKLAGETQGGLFLIDKELAGMATAAGAATA